MQKIKFDGNEYLLLEKQIGNLPLILVRAKNGYVACSYIDKAIADKIGDVAAFVSGVKDLESFKKAKIRGVTTWAEDNYGVREGMSVKKALELMHLTPEKD